MPTPDQHSWEALQGFIEGSDVAAITGFLHDLPSGEAARAVSGLTAALRVRLLELLPPEEGADLMEQLPAATITDMIEQVTPKQAAAILEELQSDDQADILGELEPEDAEAILSVMDAEEAEEARTLIRYPGDVAGGLMITEYLLYPESATVAEVLQDLKDNAEEYEDYDVQYAYVQSEDLRLVGVVPLRSLLLSRPSRVVRDKMIGNPRSVSVNDPLDTLKGFFEKNSFFGVPAVDADGRIQGVVSRTAVEHALADQSDNTYLKSQGIVGGEELRSMPFFLRSRRRLAWLSVNILLNVIAASVIAFFEDTLAQVIALAVFLPIISDMSGCSGNQAVAVSMREMTLGLARPSDAFRVWVKEVSVGALNGVLLGVLLAATAWAWKGNPWLGLVVGVAMTLNTMVAVSIGGTIPLLLKRAGKDPALASGPILTTVTDMFGFFLVLSMATLFLSRLTG